MKIKVYIDSIDQEIEFDSKKEVCHDCDGNGSVLCSGMRDHAYTAEEFSEFTEEESAEYFRHGGRYDVTCPTCQGKNVIDVIDRDKASSEDLRLLEEQEESEYRFRQEVAAERRAGC